MSDRFDYVFSSPAAGGEVLYLEVMANTSVTITEVLINGDPSRRSILLGSYTVSSHWQGRLYRLAAGDEQLAVTIDNPTAEWFVGVHVVGDEAVIPYDYSANLNAGAAATPPETLSGWSILASGLLVASVMIAASDTVVADIPPGWVLETWATGTFLSVAHAYRPIAGAGVAPAEAWTAPAARAWQVVTTPFYDVSRRFREAGAWANRGNILRSAPVGSAPGREFAEPVVSWRRPPDPSPIETPTPPWIPDGGPYRRRS